MGKEYNKYEEIQTYLSLAGSGDPWSYLSKTRKNILRALHDRIPFNEVASSFNMTLDELRRELQPLIDSSLVIEEGGEFLPTFLIVDSEETRLVYEHSKELGELLAEIIISNWLLIQDTFLKLSISKKHSLSDLAFMLVGSRILDIALLGELVKDGSLLQAAPLRPSLTKPDARYYFWMIEGEAKYLGKYGQDDIDLPWLNWHILNFGQSSIKGRRNEARDQTEKKYRDLMDSKEAKDSEEFAELLQIPFLDEADSKIWSEFSIKISKLLVERIKEKKENIISLFKNLESSKYTNNSLGEFVCWYIHLVYPWAIDYLIKEQLIPIPPEYYSEIVLYYEEPEGLFSDK